MEPVDRLYVHIRELVTLTDGPPTGARRGAGAAALGVVRDGAIAAREGRIVAVGTTDSLSARFRPREELDLSGYAVVPGFVDPQTHPVFRRAPGGALRRGRREVLAAASHEHLWSLVEHGTTSAALRSGAGLGLDVETEAMGALRDAAAEVPLRGQRTWWVEPSSDDPEASLAVARDVILPVARGLVGAVALECGGRGFSREGCGAFLRAAQELGFRTALHGDEREAVAAAELAVAHGAAACFHLGRTSLGGRSALASSDTVAVLTPAVYLLRDGGEFPSARTLWDEGCAVALATGFGPELAVPSQATSCALATACMGLTAEEALVAATLNAAVALGTDAEVGSLHPGKRCDFAVLDVPSWPEVGVGLGSNPVVLTVVDGEAVFANTHEPMPDVLGMGPRALPPGSDSEEGEP